MGVTRTKQGSVTSLKARYNDDFLLNTYQSGIQPHRYLQTTTTVDFNDVFDRTKNFSFSCFLQLSNLNPANNTFFSFSTGTGTSTRLFSCRVNTQTAPGRNISFEVKTDAGLSTSTNLHIPCNFSLPFISDKGFDAKWNVFES
jgi:hypothetical protein